MRARLVVLAAALWASVASPLVPVHASEVDPPGRIRAELIPPDGRFHPLPRWSAPDRPKLALALSGGGARGIAHLGVLASLAADGVEIDSIAGTSSGALIGAFISAGYRPEEVQAILEGETWNAIISGLDLRSRALTESEEVIRGSALFTYRGNQGAPVQVGSLVDGRQLKNSLYRYLLPAQFLAAGDFDALKYRFRAVATDLLTGRAVVPAKGDLSGIVRGSISVPAIFTTVPYEGAELVDGGLVENLPVATARGLGGEVVVAVDVTEAVTEVRRLKGAFDALNRSINIVLADQQEVSRALADAVVTPDVLSVSFTDVEANVTVLVERGSAAYATARAEIWRALEAKAHDGGTIAFDAIEVEGTSWIDGAAIAARLGDAKGKVTRFRVQVELARALNLGPLRDGYAEVVSGEAGRTLRFVFVENPPLVEVVVTGDVELERKDLDEAFPTGEPFSLDRLSQGEARLRRTLRENGHPFGRLENGSFDPDSGIAQAHVIEAEVGRVFSASDNAREAARFDRAFKSLAGSDFAFDTLAARLDEMTARGAIRSWALDPRSASNGELQMAVSTRAESFAEIAGGFGWRDSLGWAGVVRGTWANFTGRGDAAEAIVRVGHEVESVIANYRSEYLGGFRDLGLEIGIEHADGSYPLVDANQSLVNSGSEDYTFLRGQAQLVRRLGLGAVTRLGVAWHRDRFDPTATFAEEERRRTSVVLEADWDRRDRLVFPSQGFLVRLSAEDAISGDRLGRAALKLERSWTGTSTRPLTFTARASAGISSGADRRAYGFDPGGFRDLYGFIPFGAAAPDFRHGGMTGRIRFVDLGALRVYIEAGADLVRREQPDSHETILGYGVSFSALARFVGPVSLGYAHNDAGGDVLFLTVGYPFMDRR